MPSSTPERIEALKRLPLLAGASPAGLAEIAEKVTEKEFQPGEVLVRQGELGNSVYFIVSGRCEVRRGTKGVEHVLAILKEGNFFGEIAVLDPDPRTATVAALEPVKTLVLSAWEFREAVAAHPGTAFHVMKVLAARLRKVEADLAELRASVSKRRSR